MFFRTLAATPSAFLDEAKQDVLGAEVLVVEPLRLLACEVHDLLGAICEAIEHVLLGSLGAGQRRAGLRGNWMVVADSGAGTPIMLIGIGAELG